jgi:hypothetical protein
MPVHVFVDENKARGLLMAAAHVPAGDVAVNRKALRGLVLPGQERLHFNHETPARRKQIIEVIKGFQIVVDLYSRDRSTQTDRSLCLSAIVRDSAGIAERLVIERDESTITPDHRALYAARERFGCFDSLRFDLLVPKADPLLWVPDAIAWSWMRGGSWRQAVSPLCQVKESCPEAKPTLAVGSPVGSGFGGADDLPRGAPVSGVGGLGGGVGWGRSGACGRRG